MNVFTTHVGLELQDSKRQDGLLLDHKLVNSTLDGLYLTLQLLVLVVRDAGGDHRPRNPTSTTKGRL